MGIINILETHVAQLIAAGEVVERPASVVKELLENSLDSGADTITVEIKNGGVSYIRICDNGCGIARDDVKKAFLRHATSKIKSEDDLEKIYSLGFRGEALASICAVCKVKMLTRADGEEAGTLYRLEGSDEVEFSDAGCPVGTTIIVEDMFYNTPARMKFLKSDKAEGNAVAAVVDLIALSHPGVSVKLIRENEQRLNTPGDGRLLSAIYSVSGKEFAASLIEVCYELDGACVSGYICSPDAVRATRSMQFFFLNNRFVKSRTCAAALEQAYKGAHLTGKFPSCVLNLTVSADSVDINVHPAKIEVRFRDEKRIFDLVYFGVKNALSKLDVTRENSAKVHIFEREAVKCQAIQGENPPLPAGGAFVRQPVANQYTVAVNPDVFAENPPKAHYGLENTLIAPEKMQFRDNSPGIYKNAENIYARHVPAKTAQIDTGSERAVFPMAMDAPLGRFENARMIGEAFSAYIIVEDEGKLVLVDKHAAHERLIYNRLIKDIGEMQIQPLLEPVIVRLAPEEYSAAVMNTEVFKKIGFEVEDFGQWSIIVRAVPLILTGCDIDAVISQTAMELSRMHHKPELKVFDALIYSVACKAAVKAGDITGKLELEELIKLLKEDESVNFCPHGRPVAAVLTSREIEKMFGRV